MISDNDLAKIVGEFSQPRSEFDGKSYKQRRLDWFSRRMDSIRPLLRDDALDRLTLEDANHLYKEMSVGGPQMYPRTFIRNGVERIRASLKYLLYGVDGLEERFYNFVGNPRSPYRLNGVGRAFASTALLLINDKEYGIWNGAVEGGLNTLGMFPELKRGEHVGQRYIRITEALKKLEQRCDFPDLNITDEFVELVFHQTIGQGLVIHQPPVTVPDPEEAPQFFLTHSHDDANFALRLNSDLRTQGLVGFVDFFSIKPGETIAGRIDRGLDECDVYIPILSSAALKSPWCNFEIDAALNLSHEPGRKGRPLIIPVLAENCQTELTPLLKALLYINFTEDYNAGLQELLEKGFGLSADRRLTAPGTAKRMKDARRRVKAEEKATKVLGDKKWTSAFDKGNFDPPELEKRLKQTFTHKGRLMPMFARFVEILLDEDRAFNREEVKKKLFERGVGSDVGQAGRYLSNLSQFLTKPDNSHLRQVIGFRSGDEAGAIKDEYVIFAQYRKLLLQVVADLKKENDQV
jgi:hypothetical protein